MSEAPQPDIASQAQGVRAAGAAPGPRTGGQPGLTTVSNGQPEPQLGSRIDRTASRYAVYDIQAVALRAFHEPIILGWEAALTFN